MLEVKLSKGLSAMKKTATVEKVFTADLNTVYSAYWNLQLWPKALETILEAQTDYDDGIHQYFSMTVDVNGRRETVNGVRIGAPFNRIEFCHFNPPPGFVVMRGEWRFQAFSSSTGTLVSADRTFARELSGDENAAALRLEALLEKNLLAFDRYLSREAAQNA